MCSKKPTSRPNARDQQNDRFVQSCIDILDFLQLDLDF